MPEANEALRAARLGVESPSSPGTPITRQELAEAVNIQVHRTTGKVVAVDANHIGKWERGTIRWPAAYYRAALRAILNAGTDAELGFARPASGYPDTVDRKTFLKATLGASAGAVIGRHLPAPQDQRDLATAVSGPTAHYRRMEQDISSEELAPVVNAHLALATAIVRTRLSNAAGYGALAEIGGLAAWLAADRGDNTTARRRYADAIAHADRAHHPLLASYMTASLGHFAIEAGHPRQGIALLDRAVAQLDNTAPDTARAWLASLHAIGHSALGDTTATLAALRAAEKLTSRQRGEPQWPWVFVFDRAKVARYQAGALARLGDLRAATAAFDAAHPSITGAKPRALAQLEHARVLAGTGHYGEGCQLAVRALRIGREYGSERVTTRVRDFRAILPAHTAEARNLDEALAALYHPDAR